MNLALHPTEERMLTVAMYLEEFGHLARAEHVPRARCPICHGALYVIGSKSDKLKPRFSHISGERLRCPLVRNGEAPSDITVAQQADIALAQRNRERFLSQWQWHFAFMKRPQHPPSLSIARFIALLDYATLRNLWAYEALQPASVPYILLSYAGFILAGRQRGGRWLHFWFDSSVRDVHDLHVPRASPPRFFRAHYAHPRATLLPSQQHLFHMEEVSLSQSYLEDTQPAVSADDVGAFWAYLRRSEA